MREFIGAGHREVLEALRARVRDVAAGDTEVARVVILEGPSGVGKSRVVRELYRVMRADYDPQGYWPDLVEDFHTDAPDGDPLAGRKDIGPPAAGFVWPAGVLPGFGWWQLHCDRISTGMVDVAAQARPEILAHQVPLALAWKQAASGGELLRARGDQIINAARETLINDGPAEAAGQLLAQFDVAIPLLGTGLSWAVRGSQGLHRHRQQRRDIREEVDLGPRADAARRSVGTELARTIGDVAHPRLPGIVVIEDLHLMDDALAEFLDDLAAPRPNTPVIVIAMAWPEARHSGPYAHWAAKAVAAGRAQIVPMPHLSDQDLRRMILTYAPATPDDVADQAVQHLRTPLHLEAALGGAVRQAIDRNGGALPPAILTRIPRSIEMVYEKRFRSLTEEVQRGLAIAAGALPDPTSKRLWPFVRDVVADAADRCALMPSPAQILDGIDYAAHERVWLIPTGVADTFREVLQTHIAHQHLTDPTFISPTADTDIRHAVHTVLTERINHHRGDGYLLDPTDEMTLLSRWLLALTDTTTTADPDTLLTAAYRVASDQAAAYQYSHAIDTLNHYLSGQHSQGCAPDLLTIRADLATWMGRAGRINEAATAFQELLDDQRRVLRLDHPDTLRTRGNLASWMGQAGRIEEAIDALRRLLSDRLRLLRPAHPDILRTRNNLAFWLGQAGRVEEAIATLQQLLEERLLELGPNHHETLTTQNNLAFWLVRAGRAEEATTNFRGLLDQRAPSTPTEVAIAAIWAEALSRSDVTATSDFFELGGDSLQAFRVRAEIDAKLHTKVPVEAFFEFSKLEALAKYVDQLAHERAVRD